MGWERQVRDRHQLAALRPARSLVPVDSQCAGDRHWGTAIEWDGGEKFYNYVEWLEYLMGNFLIPWGYRLSGVVTWSGDHRGDEGSIIVDGNKIRVSDLTLLR